jgi:hypothetical protein
VHRQAVVEEAAVEVPVHKLETRKAEVSVTNGSNFEALAK